jgi:hypothetical protein
MLAQQKKKEQFFYEEFPAEQEKKNHNNSLEELNVRNHIIVCGIHSSIEDFIIPLRGKHLKEFQL